MELCTTLLVLTEKARNDELDFWANNFLLIELLSKNLATRNQVRILRTTYGVVQSFQISEILLDAMNRSGDSSGTQAPAPMCLNPI